MSHLDSVSALPVTGTFLDEISHDIPHQNWGRDMWRKDFQVMRAIGIDTVILIRCGYQRWLTYPSRVLAAAEGCYLPPVDLVDLFLTLAEEMGMRFFFGLYDSGKYWTQGRYQEEVELNRRVMDEVWQLYGHRPAFQGWYLSQEVSRKTGSMISTYAQMGQHAKAFHPALPILISPYIDGKKALLASQATLTKSDSVSLRQHEAEWDEILGGLKGILDIVAFQDGHVDFHELADYLKVNKQLADRHGIRCWTNAESFDRDMPIKFLPIKWEKLLLKLRAAHEAGMEKSITFEFSHFMSPHSAYVQAGHLLDRYCEYFGLPPVERKF